MNIRSATAGASRRRLLIAALIAALMPLPAQAQTTYRWVDKDGKVTYSDQPPPVDARSVQEKRLGSGNYVDTSGPSYSAQKAAQDFPVTLYTSGDCGTECKIAREFLHRRGITFSEKLIRTVSDSVSFKKATGIDELVVPTLLVGMQSQKGYEEGAWAKLLDAAGYPHGPAPLPAAKGTGPDSAASPAGAAASSPAGTAASSPAGTAASSPAGAGASSPTGAVGSPAGAKPTPR